MYPYLEMPEMVSLGGGLPHPSTLCVRSGGSLSSYQLQAENSDLWYTPARSPILQASFTLPTPPNFDGTPYVPSKNDGHATAKTAGRTTMGLYKGIGPNGERGALDLAAAQQCELPLINLAGISLIELCNVIDQTPDRWDTCL